MARYEYVILSQAVEGMEEEFERWYDEVHLADVTKIPGIVSARRSRIVSLEDLTERTPAWTSLAVYEMETDDPQSVLAAIKAVSGSPAMPLSSALQQVGLVQIVAQPVAKHP